MDAGNFFFFFPVLKNCSVISILFFKKKFKLSCLIFFHTPSLFPLLFGAALVSSPPQHCPFLFRLCLLSTLRHQPNASFSATGSPSNTVRSNKTEHRAFARSCFAEQRPSIQPNRPNKGPLFGQTGRPSVQPVWPNNAREARGAPGAGEGRCPRDGRVLGAGEGWCQEVRRIRGWGMPVPKSGGVLGKREEMEKGEDERPEGGGRGRCRRGD